MDGRITGKERKEIISYCIYNMTYIIYTKTGCPGCFQAKSLLSKEKVETIYINCDELLRIDREAFLDKMLEKTKLKSKASIHFPLVFTDDIYIGDETDLLHHLIFELDEEF